MSNLLAIPFKKTFPINVKEAVRNYIYAYGGSHPDEYKEDIKMWQNLRKDTVGVVPHVDRIDPFLLYHAHLVSIMTKLPTDIGLEIAYTPTFQPNAVPISLKSLVFERCSVLFNLASLYSQLAVSEDRSTVEGIKRATANYQYASGVLSFLTSSILSKSIYSERDEQIPLDLSAEFIKSLEWLMLAQAQECSWQLAKLNQYKNGLIAKVAARVSSLYQSAAQTILDASPPIKDVFPSDWLPHIEAKARHFAAVAQYRKSIDETETRRYGVEIARLLEAQSYAKVAYDTARRGRVAQPVLHDIQSLLDVVQKNLVRAQRDNDLIYHHDVPASSMVAPVTHTNLVSSTVPAGLSDPAKLIGEGRMIFGELVGWGAKEAINIYNDRKENLIKENIVDVSNGLQDTLDRALRRLNLPAALEALERPIGLPPSLLRKAEEVRLENGPVKIGKLIDDVERLARRDLAILDEAMDILDVEASEDEAARKNAKLDRLPSHQANTDLIANENRYRHVLTQAATSDETVRRQWDEWEANIIELTWSEEDLEASVPSSTVSSTVPITPQGKQTQIHAQALRAEIEELEDLRRTNNQVVRRAQKLGKTDDVRDRIFRVASGFEQLVEVEPAMFEDVLDEELAKYDKFLRELDDIEQRQNDFLSEVQRLNELFLQSRRDDRTIKEREQALQSLELAYHKYREITRNLDEGYKFYNDLATILLRFKEECRTWSHSRNHEIHSLTRPFQALSTDSGDELDLNPHAEVGVSVNAVTRSPPNPSRPTKTSGRKGLGLPALTSNEWGFEEIRLPPPPKGS